MLSSDAGVKPEVEARLERALGSIGRLPVLDGTARAVRELADDPHGSTDELVAVIERDEAFATNLLRLANSASLARIVRAQTIRQAVTMVGRRSLALLALEAETYRFLERAPGQGRVSRGQLHVHAVSVAGCAAGVARRSGAAVEVAHLAGLLHDIGKLVMPLAFGEDTMEAIAGREAAGVRRAQLERDELGVDHAYAGALLAGRSDAPDEIFEAIAWHHGGMSGEEAPTREAACVQVANSVSDLLAGVPADDALLHVALDRLGLDVVILDDLALEMGGDETARPQSSLAERVTQLERLAQTDELTGLSTRRHWLGTVAASLRDGEPGSLLICDVDRFKEVNDQFGHHAGDLVLTEVARVLARHGFAGRLGGDEFGVWVPGERGAGESAAARIVEETSARLLDTAARPESAGVSIGVAAGRGAESDVSALLEAADRALYAAKAGGRRRAVAAP
jgi:diguanylate cyclase (GGDEF)-like protein/putative nucleotidyltransferase with HDIG domain